MTTAVLVGSTGLVGSNILTTLLSLPLVTHITAYSRRKLGATSAKLTTLESTDIESWPGLFPKLSGQTMFISALGTTKAQAGSIDAQRKIEIDLNLALAKAAKDSGIETYVLISSQMASSASMFPYTKMKGEFEDRVKELNFKHTVILQPGLIVGTRDDSRPAEFALRKVAGLLGSLSSVLKDSWAQDAEVIARAAVKAGLECVEGKRKEEGVWLLEQPDIVRVGRTEWDAQT